MATVNWLDALLSRLAELWPFVRIPKFQRGVRTTYIPFRGIHVDTLEPGVHLQFWFFQLIHEQTVVEQVSNLPTQSVTLKDGVMVTVSANFAYEVSDAEAAVNNVFDLSDSIQGLAMMQISKKLRDWTWQELMDHQPDLERSVRDTLTTRAKEWGVKITSVGITDLVKARALRLYHDSAPTHI
jgi:regulator of protease activity HflC (stomatin/prohibitin superfamily)